MPDPDFFHRIETFRSARSIRHEFYAINGSQRKKGNTAEVLKKALEGVHSLLPAAGTELVHLYDLDFTGCRSCFACKRKGGASYGRCAVRDGLPPLLGKAG